MLRPARGRPAARAAALAGDSKRALHHDAGQQRLLLFATLRDEEMIDLASCPSAWAFTTMLPTLPDPYAANVTPLGAVARATSDARPTQLLVASVAWQERCGRRASRRRADGVCLRADWRSGAGGEFSKWGAPQRCADRATELRGRAAATTQTGGAAIFRHESG